MGWRLQHTVCDGWFGVVLYKYRDPSTGVPPERGPDVRQHVHAPALPPARKIRQRRPNGWEKIGNDADSWIRPDARWSHCTA